MRRAFNSGNFGMSIPETPSADTPMDGESIDDRGRNGRRRAGSNARRGRARDAPEVAAEAEGEGERSREESAEMVRRYARRAGREEVAEQAPEEVATPNTLGAPKVGSKKTWTGSRGSRQDHRGWLRGARRRWRIGTRR